MSSKINCLDIGCCEAFGSIYLIHAKDFLLGSNYETFAKIVSETHVLSENQWSYLLNEWGIKETILK